MEMPANGRREKQENSDQRRAFNRHQKPGLADGVIMVSFTSMTYDARAFITLFSRSLTEAIISPTMPGTLTPASILEV